MGSTRSESTRARSRRASRTKPYHALGVFVLLALVLLALSARPLGNGGVARAMGQGIDVRRVRLRGETTDARPTAAERIAWEIRKRTSIETELTPSTARLDDPSIFQTPLLYWAGDHPFGALTDAELTGLRRFVEYGGFVLIDDATPELDGFDQSVRRELGRAFPSERLVRLPSDHTIYRSFYLVSDPVGRVAEPSYLEAVVHAGRAAVVYSRHDLGGAWARDARGQAVYDIVPGGAAQREQAIRLGVNLVMYALCLDYKDDQVHAPFILRRRGGQP